MRSRVHGGQEFIRAALVVLMFVASACASDDGTQPGHSVPGGNAERGRELISQHACASCHVVPGVHDARGHVGPPLDHFDRRTYIAGVMPNNLESLMMWIMNPQRVLPGNAMPNMQLSARDARDIAAYLYTLR